MHEHRRKSAFGIFAVMLPLWMSVSMAAGPVDPPAGVPQEGPPAEQPGHVGELPGEGPFGQFIVKYRPGSEAFRDPETAQARIEDTTRRSATGSDADGAEASWLRRLGVGADVFRLSQPLARPEARRLMEDFAADPQVEYIEADSLMTIQRPSMGIR